MMVLMLTVMLMLITQARTLQKTSDLMRQNMS